MNDIINNIKINSRIRKMEIAIIGSKENITWIELYNSINKTKAALNNTRILGILIQNSPQWIIIDLAAMEKEITKVPMATFFTKEQIRHLIEDSNIDTVISEYPELIRKTAEVKKEETIIINGKNYIVSRIKTKKREKRSLNDIDKITYTSGTTGKPKGVLITRKMIHTVAKSLVQASEGKPTDRAMVIMPLSILLENIASVYVPILAGATIIIPNNNEIGITGSSSINMQYFIKSIFKYKPTTIVIPPILLKILIQMIKEGHEVKTLRFIAVGGAPIGKELLQQSKELKIPVFQGYGLSEAGSVVTLNTKSQNKIGSVGKPLPHIKIKIDKSNRILISGNITKGYLNKSVTNINGWMDTGDIGYIDKDGYLFITGRRKTQIITAYGRNISPEWIESELSSYKEIIQTAVYCNNEKGITAVIIVNRNVNAEQVINIVEKVNNSLPDYARIKNYIISDKKFSIKNKTLSASGTPLRKEINKKYTN